MVKKENWKNRSTQSNFKIYATSFQTLLFFNLFLYKKKNKKFNFNIFKNNIILDNIKLENNLSLQKIA